MLPTDNERVATKSDIDRLESLMEKFDQRLWDFHGALRAQTRVYIGAMVGTVIAFAGVFLGIQGF